MNTPALAMNNDTLGSSRGRVGGRYYLMSPDTMVENSLPFLPPDSSIILTAPQGLPARFGQVLLTLSAGESSTGLLGCGFQNFVFVVDGSVTIRSEAEEWTLSEESYLFLPQGREFEIVAVANSRLLWVKKRYVEVAGIDHPEIVTGSLAAVHDQPDDAIDGSYGQLLPSDTRYDMAMNIMRFEPGARFRMVEIHHQEHGLYMLQGGGIYHLDGDHLEVVKDDFIYMAPYCTQAFTVAGAGASAYLLYKDVNRDGF